MADTRKLTEEELKKISGGNIEFAGMSFSAEDLLNLWNTYKGSPLLNLYKGAFKANKQAIINEFTNSGVTMPDDLVAYLNNL